MQRRTQTQSRLQNNTQGRQVPSLLRANKVAYRTSSKSKNAKRSTLPLEAIELSSYTVKRNITLPLSDVSLSDAGRRASGKGSTGRQHQTSRRGQVPFHVSNNPGKKCRKVIRAGKRNSEQL